MARRQGDEPQEAARQGDGESKERFENRGGGASFRLDFSVFCDALGASAGVEMVRRGELPRVLEMGRSSHTWEAECACALLCRLAMIRECQGALLAEGVPEQLLQLLLQAEPGPNQQRLLEALHCLSARPASDTLPAPLCSPACVARLLLLASDAELMSGGDRVRLLTATLLSKLAHETPTALLLAHGQDELCSFVETAMATGDTAALGAGLKVLSTARETLARAAAASVSGEGEADELITTHRTRRLLRALLAERGVSEAVRGEARQLQHATRHGKHGQHGKRAAATEDKDELPTAVLTAEDKGGRTAGRRRGMASISAPEISAPEISAPEISAPEISAPEISGRTVEEDEPETSGRTEILSSRRSSGGTEIELPWEMRDGIVPEAAPPPVGERADHDTGRSSSDGRWPAPSQPQPQPADGMSPSSCHAKAPPKPRPLGVLGAGVNSPRKLPPSPLARMG